MDGQNEREELKLSEAAIAVIDECRMVLPGIQALFGFQMIAVFSDGFGEKLTRGEQQLHLVAIALVVLSIGLVMTPAALHRIAEPRSASGKFIRAASRLILAGMMVLALAICVDAFLVAAVVLHDRAIASIIAIGLMVQFIFWWQLYPVMYRRR